MYPRITPMSWYNHHPRSLISSSYHGWLIMSRPPVHDRIYNWAMLPCFHAPFPLTHALASCAPPNCIMQACSQVDLPFLWKMGIRTRRASTQGQLDPKSRVNREVVSVMKYEGWKKLQVWPFSKWGRVWQQILCCVFTQTLTLGLFGQPPSSLALIHCCAFDSINSELRLLSPVLVVGLVLCPSSFLPIPSESHSHPHHRHRTLASLKTW